MIKALLMVMSGVLIASTSSSWAMNQTEMEEHIAAKTGLTKTQAHNALDAFEKQLEAEMVQKKAVNIEGFGVYRPREMVGQRHGKDPRTGADISYDNWKLVQKPEVMDTATFNTKAAERAGMSEADYNKAFDIFKETTGLVIRRGNSVAMHGEGTYGIRRVAVRSYKRDDGGAGVTVKAHYAIRHTGYGAKKHQFKASKEMTCKLNNNC